MVMQEVVQLVANVTADHSAIDTAIANLTKRLNELEGTFRQTYGSQETASKKSAQAVEATQEELWEQTQKGLLNQLDYESKIQGSITSAYREALKDRLNIVEKSSSEARSIYSKLAADQIAQEKSITTAKRAEIEIRNNLLKSQIMSSGDSNWRQGVRDYDTNQAMHVITQPGLYSVGEQEAASKRIIQIARQEATEQESIARQNTLTQGKYYSQIAEEESISIKQREAAQSTLAESEFTANRISRDDYRAYLTQKTEDFADYTAEYRAAKMRLAQLDAQDNADQLVADKQFLAERLSELKEYYTQYDAVTKEANALVAYQPGKIDLTDKPSLAKTEASLQGVGKGIGSTLGYTAAGISAIEVASAVMASGFNHNMTTIANNTLMTNNQLDDMRKTVLDLGTSTGASFEDLARGYMHISNFGNDAVDTTKELTLANKEAIATGSSTEDVANALATSLHIFGANANEAKGYMDVLHHSAAAGNLMVQDFVKSAGPAFALAAEMHDKFYDAATAVSVLSKAGFDPSEAATQIKSLVSHTADPTNEATKAITALNEAYHKLAGSDPKLNLLEDFTQAGIQAKGILGVMKDLETVTGGRASEVLSTVPALRGGIGALFLAQSQSGLDNPFVTKNGVNAVQDQLNSAKALQLSNTGSETQAVFDRMKLDPQQQWAAFSNTLQSKFIPVGTEATKVLIAMEPVILKITDKVVDLMRAFQELPPPVQDVITLFGAGVLVEKFTGVFSILTKIPVAIGSMTTGFPKLIEAFQLTAGGAGSLSESLGAVGLNTAALVAAGGPVILAIAAFSSFGYAIYSVTNQLQKNADASKQAAEALADFHAVNAKLQSDGSAGQIGASLDRVQLAETTTQSHIARLFSYDPSIDTKGYNGPLKAEYDAEVKQLAQQKEQDADLTKQWNAALKVHDALNEAKWKKDGTLTPPPSSGGNGLDTNSPSVTAQNLSNEYSLEKSAAEAHKEALATQKTAQEYYDKEIKSLERIIEYKQKENAEDLDTNKHLDQANFDLTNKVAIGNKSKLLGLAGQADQVSHEEYIDTILQKAQQSSDQKSNPLVGRALTATGIDIDAWQQLAKLGPVMSNGYTQLQNKVMTLGLAIEATTAQVKAKKAADDADAAYKLSLPENHILSGAVSLAGGYDAWQRMGNGNSALQKQYLSISQTSSQTEDSTYLNQLIAKDALINKNPQDPDAMSPGQKAIQEYLTSKNMLMPTDPIGIATITGIGNEANKQAGIDSIQELKKATRELATQASVTSIALKDMYNPVQKAVDDWEAQNKKLVKDVAEPWGVGSQALTDYENQLRSDAIADLSTKIQTDTLNITQKTSQVAADNGNYKTAGDKAVAVWLASDAGQQAVAANTTAQGQLTQVIQTEIDTIKKQTNLQQQIEENAARRQQLVSGVSSSIVGGILGGLSGGSVQGRGSVQTQLLSYQQEMQQLLVQQAAFKQQYPNDPNNPYSTEIQQVQQDINKTQNQFNSMGNSVTATFTRIFQSIEKDFNSLITSMAQKILESQLNKWISGAIGGGISNGPLAPTSSGGSGIGGLLGGALNFVMGSGLGSSNVPTTTATVGGASLAYPTLWNGFSSGGGYRKDGSMYHLHYAAQGWEVPGIPGAGDVYPAMLSPKEVVLPVSLASKIKTMTDSSNSTPVINNSYSFRQIVNTPDIVGFRQSKKTQIQSMRRAIQKGM